MTMSMRKIVILLCKVFAEGFNVSLENGSMRRYLCGVVGLGLGTKNKSHVKASILRSTWLFASEVCLDV